MVKLIFGYHELILVYSEQRLCLWYQGNVRLSLLKVITSVVTLVLNSIVGHQKEVLCVVRKVADFLNIFFLSGPLQAKQCDLVHFLFGKHKFLLSLPDTFQSLMNNHLPRHVLM